MDTQKDTTPEGPAQAAPRATLLLIDDEEYIRELLSACLSIEGYKVLTADGPTEALKHCADHPGPIDLVLCEAFFSGGWSGLDLMNRIQEARPAALSLFMTGFPEEALIGIDMAGVLAKPFTPATLYKKVQTVLKKKVVLAIADQGKAGAR